VRRGWGGLVGQGRWMRRKQGPRGARMALEQLLSMEDQMDEIQGGRRAGDGGEFGEASWEDDDE